MNLYLQSIFRYKIHSHCSGVYDWCVVGRDGVVSRRKAAEIRRLTATHKSNRMKCGMEMFKYTRTQSCVGSLCQTNVDQINAAQWDPSAALCCVSLIYSFMPCDKHASTITIYLLLLLCCTANCCFVGFLFSPLVRAVVCCFRNTKLIFLNFPSRISFSDSTFSVC